MRAVNPKLHLLAAVVLAGGALAAAATGCEAIANPDRSKLPHGTATATGGGSSSASTGGTGGTGGTASCAAGQACGQVAECPAPSTACVLATCHEGCCGTTPAPMATACKEGGGKLCDGSGACVACLATSDCAAPTTACKVVACDASHACATTPAAKGTACSDGGGVVCDGNGACVAKHCMDGVKDADETDVDCGGSCGATCKDTGPQQACKAAGDCVSHVCTGMLCQPPTCKDGVKNGNETDKDCGGADCDALGITCDPGLGCGVPADCTGAAGCSGTVFTSAADCVGSVCQAGFTTDCSFSSQVCDPVNGCVACTAPKDCPPTGNECVVPTCTSNTCGTMFLDQTHVLSTGQVSGDCQQIVCNGSGGTTSVDDATDVPPPSGTVCATSPTCAGTPLAPSYTVAPTGTDCTADSQLPKHVCGDTTDPAAAGKCVECNTIADCAADAGTCTNHVCQ